MYSQFRSLVFFALILFAAATLRAQNPDEPAKAKKDPTASPAAAPVDDSYKIGDQDVLKIDVWKEPDITRQVTVRPDGKISLPLLDDIQATGYTPLELAKIIREGLKKFINEPEVTVTVTEINSRRIYVTGEVMHAGAMTLLPNMTVLQALSSSGGFTQFANTKKIYILRVENGKQIRIPVNYRDVVSGRKPEENILLQAGDTIVVP
jgi:polysaccharide export outer membrane protein